MGGRGSFSPLFGRTGGIPFENRQYSTIGNIGRIKIVQCDTKSNNPTITYSNMCNTTYFSYSKEHGSIEHIYYFKKHKLVKSVDFNEGIEPHTHYYNGVVVGRKRHDKHNNHALSERDRRLMNLALNYNKNNGTKKTD